VNLGIFQYTRLGKAYDLDPRCGSDVGRRGGWDR